MLRNVKLINQNLTQVNMFINCPYNTQINLENLYFYGNIFPPTIAFSLNTGILIMVDSVFVQNIIPYQLINLRTPYRESSLVYMNNNKFQDNIFSFNVITIDSLNNAMISNFTIQSNTFITFFEMDTIMETASFQNISFIENNQNPSHYAHLFPFLPEATFTLVGPYGACIDLYSVSNVNMSFLFFNGNSGNLFPSTNILISATRNVLLNNSEFKNNIQEKCSGISCSVGFSLEGDSSKNITLSMENLFFFNNSILEITETPSGPCMWVEQSFSVSIKNSVFANNFNNLWSLCLYITSYNVLLQNCSFVDHIYNDQKLYFTLNKTRMGVFLVDFHNFTIFNSIFSNNKAFQGTSLYIFGSNYNSQLFYQENVTYFHNSAFSSSSSIYVESSSIDREYNSFYCYFLYSVTVDDLGLFYFGSIYGLHLQHFNFFRCNFFGNAGSTSASVTELYPPDPVNIFLLFNQCIFSNNSQIASKITVGGLINIWGEALGTNKPVLRIERSVFRSFFNYIL